MEIIDQLLPEDQKEPDFTFTPAAPKLHAVQRFALQDVFLVSPEDLIRKAGDELVLGLRWFVIFTMLHSTLDSARKPIEFRSKTPLQFNSGKGTVAPDQDVVFKFETCDKNSFTSIQAKLGKMLEHTQLQDFRGLINHLQHVVRGGVDKNEDYYSNDVLQHANKLKRCFTCFWHQNYLVPRLGEQNTDTIEATAIRVNETVRITADTIGDFLVGIKLTSPTCSADASPAERACHALFNAAKTHFDAVLKVLRLVRVLMRITPEKDIPKEEQKRLMEKLHSLVEKEDERAVNFAVLHLWTRFGNRSSSDTSQTNQGAESWEGETEELFDQSKIERMGHVRVTRWEVSKKPGESLVENPFDVSALGVTNVDMLNRALELCARSLRKVFILAVGHKTKKFAEVLQGIKKLEAPNEGKIFKAELLGEGKGPLCFLEIPGKKLSERSLFTHFVKVNGLEKENNAQKLVVAFVRHDPNWSCLRFILRFLTKNHNGRIPDLAEKILQIRDLVKHYVNVAEPQRFSFKMVKVHVATISTLVEEAYRYFGLEDCVCVKESDNKQLESDKKDLDTFLSAISEIELSLDYYFEWRRRQRIAARWCSKADASAKLNALNSTRSLRNLLEPLKLSASVEVRDGSPESLRALLTILQFAQSRKKKPPTSTNVAVSTAMEPSGLNPFMILSYESDEE